MAFKLVENNLSPMQRRRSQVKEKQDLFKRLERSLIINAATLFKIQTYTNNILWQCSHSFTLQQFTRKRIASEKRSATCTSSPTYQLSVTSSSNTQQRNRSTLFYTIGMVTTSYSKCSFNLKKRKFFTKTYILQYHYFNTSVSNSYAAYIISPMHQITVMIHQYTTTMLIQKRVIQPHYSQFIP